MQEKPDSLHTLGLDFTGQTIRGVQLSLRKGIPVADKLFDIPVSSQSADPSEPPHYSLVHDEPGLREAMAKNLSVTTLPVSEVLVRQLEVKLKKLSDIDAVLAFQAEPLLPYPVENACLDRTVLGETSEGHLIALMSVRKDHLQHHLDLWRALDVEPEAVTASVAALAAFMRLTVPSKQLQCVIHVGETLTTCALVREGKLLAAKGCYFGLNNLLNAFKQDDPDKGNERFGQLDFAEVQKEATPHLMDAVEQLRMEITRALYALSKQAKGNEVEQILLTGDGASLTHFGAALLQPLAQTLNKPLIIPDTPEGLSLSNSDMHKFAIPLGAALMGLPGAEMINFRQEEFAYPKPWKRYKQPILLYFALSIGLALALTFAGKAYVRYKEDGLRREYSELLASMNIPYTEFEKSFTKKRGGAESESVVSIRRLSQGDIASRLQFLQKEIQSSPDTYPLLPNVPTVSDLLAWLSTHPNVAVRDPKTGRLKPLLELENLSYTMIKRPEQTKKQEKYQVKVELEFSSETPKEAREFHDALIAPNAMVDPKGEVKWSTNRGLYRASFFLKDKTAYPTPSS